MSQALLPWQSIEDVRPPERTHILVCGDSGSNAHPSFIMVAYYDHQYRRSLDGQIRWLTIDNDALTDYGYVPTHWCEVPWTPVVR